MWILAILLLGILTSGCSYMLCASGLSCSAYYEEKLDKAEAEWNQ